MLPAPGLKKAPFFGKQFGLSMRCRQFSVLGLVCVSVHLMILHSNCICVRAMFHPSLKIIQSDYVIIIEDNNSSFILLV